jgi:UDP-2,3-diacylglucosamine hydrolase
LAGTLFISDLHLDPNRPNITRAFARFLHDNRRCERLYILGDLVESWIGDDDNSPLVTEIATLLSAFTDAGPQLFIMHGNRDFLIGESFCQRIKAQLITDPTSLTCAVNRHS